MEYVLFIWAAAATGTLSVLVMVCRALVVRVAKLEKLTTEMQLNARMEHFEDDDEYDEYAIPPIPESRSVNSQGVPIVRERQSDAEKPE